MRTARILLLGVLLLAGAGVAAFYFGPHELRWRVRVVGLAFTGQIDGVPMRDLFRWLRPGSPVFLEGLAETPNADAAIHPPPPTATDIAEGARTFGRLCAHCHGPEGKGAAAPSLWDVAGTRPPWTFFSAVRYGRPDTAMQPQAVTEAEAWQVLAYVRGLTSNGGALEGVPPALRTRLDAIDVQPEALHASAGGGDWPTYSGTVRGHRYSPLAQIDVKNVGGLRNEWVRQLGAADLYLESSPVVVNGIMFVTGSPHGVTALDAATGKPLWKFARPVPSDLPLCCGSTNRGVAILGHTVFVATLDAHLVALDARNGTVLWDRTIAEPSQGYAMTGAPLVANDRVVIGVAGSEFGARGFVAAHDPRTGDELWRFHTIPAPGEAGHDTWGTGDAWRTGGAATWMTGSFDDGQDLVLWGVGNPSPLFDGRTRPGDNLYANSVLALERATGKLRWHFQFTPHDVHDWDATQVPLIVDLPAADGGTLPALLTANRNGFFYSLDRRTGGFIHGRPFVKQTWAKSLDPAGRPVVDPASQPNERGVLVWPSLVGGTNWWPPSFHQPTGVVVVAALERAGVFFRRKNTTRLEAGDTFFGSSWQPAAGLPTHAGLKAIRGATGEEVWEFVFPEQSPGSPIGGVLTTAGDLAFSGHDETFYAVDVRTGEELWRFRAGGKINAPPVSYSVDGRQFIAVALGHGVFAFALP